MRNIFRRSTALLGGAMAAAVLVVTAAATPAAAQPAAGAAPGNVTVVAAASSCPDGEFCVWTSSPFTGSSASFFVGSSNLAKFKSGQFDRAITDVWNRTGDSTFCLFDQPDYSGNRLRIAPSSQGRYVGAAWNDRARSLHFC